MADTQNQHSPLKNQKESFLNAHLHLRVRIHFINGSYVEGTLIAYDNSALVLETGIKNKNDSTALSRHQMIPEGQYLRVEEIS